jgi:hypothetical protein
MFFPSEENTGDITSVQSTAPFGCPQAELIWTFPPTFLGERSTTLKVGNETFARSLCLATETQRRWVAPPLPPSTQFSFPCSDREIKVISAVVVAIDNNHA